jgi:hypothetical protein
MFIVFVFRRPSAAELHLAITSHHPIKFPADLTGIIHAASASPK